MESQKSGLSQERNSGELRNSTIGLARTALPSLKYTREPPPQYSYTRYQQRSERQMQQRRVSFFNYAQLFQAQAPQFMEVVHDVLARGAYIMQRDLQEFETAFADFIGCRHAIGVGNCTDGLQLALAACGIEPGDEIVLPSHTFVASAGAVHAAGGVPVPVDCGPDHLVDPDSVEGAITDRTRFIMPVQVNGRIADMDSIMTIAQARNITVIEDAAQGFGAKYKGRHGGTFGRAAAFSFYPAKLLGCFGDGGMVVSDDDEVARLVRMMRDHGRNEHGRIERWGRNSRLDNLQAAVLNMQLDEYPDMIARRRAIAASYHAGLHEIEELVLPPRPDADPDRFDVYQNYEMEATSRDALRDHLGQRGVGTMIQWGGQPVHSIPGLGFHVSLPNTERLFERCLMLPMNTTLSDEDVEYVIESVKAFYAG